jgi:hypothetical protein
MSMTSTTAAPWRPLTAGARPLLEVTAFVAVWLALGLAVRNPAVYLLLGIPLTVAFQRGIRRRPLRELWVRNGEPFRLDRLGRIFAGLLLVTPLVMMVRALASADWVTAAVYAAVAGGAVAGAYALRQLRRTDARTSLRWLAISCAVAVPAVLISGLPSFLRAADRASWGSVLGTGIVHLLWLVPGMFVIEEVVFRGLLDTHVQRPGARHGWLSAVYVCALWGVWHIPFSAAAGLSNLPLPTLVAGLVFWHCLLGIPLAYAWRRTGNLTVPAATHGIADAIRDALAI